MRRIAAILAAVVITLTGYIPAAHAATSHGDIRYHADIRFGH